MEAQQRSYELVRGWLDLLPAPIRFLNLGGGFGIPYSDRDPVLDTAPIFDSLHDLAARLPRDVGPQARIVVELGRYLVGEAGLYVCRVVDRKVSRDKVFLVTDGGMHHHLAASGNFGQVMRRNYPIALNGVRAQRETVSSSARCARHWPARRQRRLDRAEPGDLVAVFQSGHTDAPPARASSSAPDAAEALV